MPTVAEIAGFLERFAPARSAADWDNVGLLIGDATAAAERVLTCLTITSEVVEEAIVDRAQLIVSHHPVLFRAVKKLTGHTPDGRLLLPLLRAGIAVHSPHTAFDNCPGGINDSLTARLGLSNVVPLRPGAPAKSYKLVVFVPEGDLAKVSDALFAAGGGRIGQYEQCSYRVNGTGTFFGGDATNPTIGQKGRREEVAEWRLEVVVPEASLGPALCAMRAAHSYEEPAFDVYPLHHRETIASHGEGRIGDVPATTLGELARRAKERLGANGVQIVGDERREVRRVAIACGAAGEFLADAIRAKADVFLTGEVRFHEALASKAANVGLILPGHYATERLAVEELADRLAREFPAAAVWASRRERDPLANPA
jgi:dinuclear metal center YbgI/SA1388 family protein